MNPSKHPSPQTHKMHMFHVVITMPDNSTGIHTDFYEHPLDALYRAKANFPSARRISVNAGPYRLQKY